MRTGENNSLLKYSRYFPLFPHWYHNQPVILTTWLDLTLYMGLWNLANKRAWELPRPHPGRQNGWWCSKGKRALIQTDYITWSPGEKGTAPVSNNSFQEVGNTEHHVLEQGQHPLWLWQKKNCCQRGMEWTNEGPRWQQNVGYPIPTL